MPLLFHFERTKSFRFKFQVTIFLFLSPFVFFLYSRAARVISQIINQSRLTLTVCVLTELARNGERQLRKDGKANHPFRTRGSIVILVGGQFYLRTLFPILRGCPLTRELAVDILSYWYGNFELICQIKNVSERCVLINAVKKNVTNPLTPMSDQDRISPHNVNTISSRQGMRLKKNRN